MRRKIRALCSKYLIVIGIILAIVSFSQSIEKKPLLAEDGTEFAKAVVTETSRDNLQAVTGNETGDSQEVTLRIRSGKYEGKIVKGYSMNGYLYGADCKVGTKVIVKLSEYKGNISASVYNYDREFEITMLILFFLATMWLVGGKKGFNSIIALIFTFVVVIMLYVPLMYVGVSPFLAAVLSVILITVITHILLADLQIKSISAMIPINAKVIIIILCFSSL